MTEKRDWAYRKIWETVEQKASWDTLNCSHPAKMWNLELSELRIRENKGVMTYKGKVFVPASGVKRVVRSLHKGHMGVTTGQQRAYQTWFWPTMGRDINRAMGV